MQRHTLALVCVALLFAGVGSATPILFTGSAGPPHEFFLEGFVKADFFGHFGNPNPHGGATWWWGPANHFNSDEHFKLAGLDGWHEHGGRDREPDHPDSQTPEPASMALIGLGLAGLGWGRKRLTRVR